MEQKTMGMFKNNISIFEINRNFSTKINQKQKSCYSVLLLLKLFQKCQTISYDSYFSKMLVFLFHTPASPSYFTILNSLKQLIRNME